MRCNNICGIAGRDVQIDGIVFEFRLQGIGRVIPTCRNRGLCPFIVIMNGQGDVSYIAFLGANVWNIALQTEHFLTLVEIAFEDRIIADKERCLQYALEFANLPSV